MLVTVKISQYIKVLLGDEIRWVDEFFKNFISRWWWFFLSYFSYFCVLFSTTKILKSLLDGPVLSDGQIIGRASIYGVCTDERHPMNNSRVSLVV